MPRCYGKNSNTCRIDVITGSAATRNWVFVRSSLKLLTNKVPSINRLTIEMPAADSTTVLSLIFGSQLASKVEGIVAYQH